LTAGVCVAVEEAPRNSPTAGLQQTVPDLQRSHAKVRYPDVVLLIQQQVLWFQISVAAGLITAGSRGACWRKRKNKQTGQEADVKVSVGI